MFYQVAANGHEIHPSASPSAGIIVGGTSSGGNIANAVVYLNRDQTSPVKVTGQFLSVPPLIPAPVVPDKYRQDYTSVEQNNAFSIPPPELIQVFLCKYLLMTTPYSLNRGNLYFRYRTTSHSSSQRSKNH